MALTNAQLKERKSLLEDIEKSELKIAGHTAVIEKGTGLTNKQLRDMATNREKATQELKKQRKELSDIQKDEDKINAFEHTEAHKILVEKTEAKNEDYVKGLC